MNQPRKNLFQLYSFSAHSPQLSFNIQKGPPLSGLSGQEYENI
jgi:hypothetical protein